MGNCFLYKRGGGFGGAIPDIVKVALGKVISLSDSKDAKLKGLRIFGKTTQKGTATPEAPVPLESVGDGGSVGVTVAGKNILSDNYNDYVIIRSYLTLDINPQKKEIILSLTDRDTAVDISGCYFGLIENAEEATDPNTYKWALNNGQLDYSTLKANFKQVFIYPSRKTAFEKITARYNIQVEFGTVATSYEPYKETQPLTIQKPTDVPVLLPGIPVSSGGNYADENGQQWICDEVDFARGKYVQRIGKIDSYANQDVPGAYLSTTGSLSAGAEVLYVLPAPVETPLPPEELAQYASLHTNLPNTTIYNDAGAGMEVKYTLIGG